MPLPADKANQTRDSPSSQAEQKGSGALAWLLYRYTPYPYGNTPFWYPEAGNLYHLREGTPVEKDRGRG